LKSPTRIRGKTPLTKKVKTSNYPKEREKKVVPCKGCFPPPRTGGEKSYPGKGLNLSIKGKKEERALINLQTRWAKGGEEHRPPRKKS